MAPFGICNELKRPSNRGCLPEWRGREKARYLATVGQRISGHPQRCLFHGVRIVESHLVGPAAVILTPEFHGVHAPLITQVNVGAVLSGKRGAAAAGLALDAQRPLVDRNALKR